MDIQVSLGGDALRALKRYRLVDGRRGLAEREDAIAPEILEVAADGPRTDRPFGAEVPPPPQGPAEIVHPVHIGLEGRRLVLTQVVGPVPVEAEAPVQERR